jgi:diaminopimelate decarboxylase
MTAPPFQRSLGQDLPEDVKQMLAAAARRFGTPSYVYFVDRMRGQIDRVRDAFGRRFTISYAVKSNPNEALLRAFHDKVGWLDCSSIGEVERGLAAGYPATRLTFSGPAKRSRELERAVEVGVGELVCESVEEIEELDGIAAAAGRTVSIAVRISPNRVPAGFGVNMGGKPTQFGIDEDDVGIALDRAAALRHVRLETFHIYSGTNCLSATAIAENFGIFADLFARFSAAANLQPKRLIFGSGIGVPYVAGDKSLEVEDVAALTNPLIDEMKRDPRLAHSECVLEMGRYLVAPFGYLLARVVRLKRSRGVQIALCDAGFNNHLSACGMMGQVIRRNWSIWNVSADPTAGSDEYMLTGPLCTTIDLIAQKISLPHLEVGDVIAIGFSGAYGLTASPTRFISHPEPAEIGVFENGTEVEMTDITLAGDSVWRAGRSPAR